jgi:hypothetical protein
MQACPALYSTYMLVLPQGMKTKEKRRKRERGNDVVELEVGGMRRKMAGEG